MRIGLPGRKASPRRPEIFVGWHAKAVDVRKRTMIYRASSFAWRSSSLRSAIVQRCCGRSVANVFDRLGRPSYGNSTYPGSLFVQKPGKLLGAERSTGGLMSSARSVKSLTRSPAFPKSRASSAFHGSWSEPPEAVFSQWVRNLLIDFVNAV